jgi:hypothetical protein
VDPAPVHSPCLICVSTKRKSIETAILTSTPYITIEKDHGLKPGEARRHARTCSPTLLATAADTVALKDPNAIPMSALERATLIAESSYQGVINASKKPDTRAHSQAVQASTKANEHLARLLGETGADQEARIAESAKFQKFIILLTAALKPEPKAWDLVKAVLKDLEKK